MFRRILYFSVLCFLILSGCTKTTVELPAPDILYSDVAEAAMLSEMIELTSEELQNLVGIDPKTTLNLRHIKRAGVLQQTR